LKLFVIGFSMTDGFGLILLSNAVITGATEAPERKSTAVWRPVHKFVIPQTIE
jgi:hypothetical protein